jgi:hypothetical protein
MRVNERVIVSVDERYTSRGLDTSCTAKACVRNRFDASKTVRSIPRPFKVATRKCTSVQSTNARRELARDGLAALVITLMRASSRREGPINANHRARGKNSKKKSSSRPRRRLREPVMPRSRTILNSRANLVA